MARERWRDSPVGVGPAPSPKFYSEFCIQHFAFLSGAVLVSTGVVRLDKRAVAPDHDKTGTFLKLTDNNNVAFAA